MQFYYRAPIVIERARGVKLHGNTVAGINCDGVTADDPYTLAGAVFDGNCSFCDSHGNTWGGGINDPISDDAGKGAKWGVYFASGVKNSSASNERSSGLDLAGGGVVHGLDQSYPGHTAAGADSGEAAKLRAANQELAVRVEKLEAAQERMMLLLEAQAPR